MLTKTSSAHMPRPLPADVADVAFLDIKDVIAAVRMSASWIHDAVRAGTFPAPLRYGNRCSRWQAASIRKWLIDRAAEAAAADKGAALTAKAKRASAVAKAKRQGA
jgi:prophage regulatory protein